MMYKEIRIQEIPCITFLKGTKYNLYVGPKLSWFERTMQKFLKMFPRTSSVEILLARGARTIVGGGLKSSKILPAKEICIAIQLMNALE